MNTLRLLGTCIYQADIKPKNARNFRRADMFTLIEYEIPNLSGSDVVHDAVVVMPADMRQFDRHHSTPPAAFSYTGWNDALWRRASYRNDSVSVETYANCLRTPPSPRNRPSCDPIFDSRVNLSSPNGLGYLSDDDLYDADNFSGVVSWSNKATRVAAHVEAAKLVAAIDGEIWHRHPGPTWQVADSNSSRPQHGHVILNPDTSRYPSSIGDLFRLDRLGQASELSTNRFGMAEVHGEILQMDPRFVTRDDVACMFHTHLAFLINKGEQFLPHLAPDAIQAYVDLYHLFKTRTPWSPHATTDADHVMDRVGILKEAMFTPALPGRLLDTAKAIVSSLDLVIERVRLDRRATQTLADDAAIASLALTA